MDAKNCFLLPLVSCRFSDCACIYLFFLPSWSKLNQNLEDKKETAVIGVVIIEDQTDFDEERFTFLSDASRWM